MMISYYLINTGFAKAIRSPSLQDSYEVAMFLKPGGVSPRDTAYKMFRRAEGAQQNEAWIRAGLAARLQRANK